jgi:hypothetical protein
MEMLIINFTCKLIIYQHLRDTHTPVVPPHLLTVLVDSVHEFDKIMLAGQTDTFQKWGKRLGIESIRGGGAELVD